MAKKTIIGLALDAKIAAMPLAAAVADFDYCCSYQERYGARLKKRARMRVYVFTLFLAAVAAWIQTLICGMSIWTLAVFGVIATVLLIVVLLRERTLRHELRGCQGRMDRYYSSQHGQTMAELEKMEPATRHERVTQIIQEEEEKKEEKKVKTLTRMMKAENRMSYFNGLRMEVTFTENSTPPATKQLERVSDRKNQGTERDIEMEEFEELTEVKEPQPEKELPLNNLGEKIVERLRDVAPQQKQDIFVGVRPEFIEALLKS